MKYLLLTLLTTVAFASPRLEVSLGASDGRPVDDAALQKILKITAAGVARGEITQLQSDYGIEGDLYLCLGFDWSASSPEMVAPARKRVLDELRAVPVTPGSGNQKSVEQVEKCAAPN